MRRSSMPVVAQSLCAAERCGSGVWVWGGAVEVGMGRRAAAWGFKGEGQGLGVRARDGKLAGDLGVMGVVVALQGTRSCWVWPVCQ